LPQASNQNQTVGASQKGLLAKLRERLDRPLSWECKRQLIEVLVGGIRVDTIDEDGKRSAIVTVTYRFADSVNNCTGIRADINCYIEQVYGSQRRQAGLPALAPYFHKRTMGAL